MSSSDGELILTIRLIRSFEHRNIRFLVIKGLRSHQNVGELKRTISERIKDTPSIPPPFKRFNFDSLKINSFAHGHKSNDTAITLDHDDEWVMDDLKTLKDYNIKNEAELSFYCNEDYQKYKQNPRLLW